MNISKKIYIDPNLKNTKITLWKLKRNKNVGVLYCVIYTENHFLEIMTTNKLEKHLEQGTIIGISKTKMAAVKIVEQIFQDIYIPNPDISFMREYFT